MSIHAWIAVVCRQCTAFVFHQPGCQSIHTTREEAFVVIEMSTTNGIPAIYLSKRRGLQGAGPDVRVLGCLGDLKIEREYAH